MTIEQLQSKCMQQAFTLGAIRLACSAVALNKTSLERGNKNPQYPDSAIYLARKIMYELELADRIAEEIKQQ